jgi:hypothetical protein
MQLPVSISWLLIVMVFVCLLIVFYAFCNVYEWIVKKSHKKDYLSDACVERFVRAENERQGAIKHNGVESLRERF